MKNTALLTALLAVSIVLSPHPAFCAASPPPEVARTLTMPGYWIDATPAQVRALVGKYSLAGGRAEVRHEPAYTPLMLAAKSSPYGEIIDFLIRAGCAVNAEAEARIRFRRPGAADKFDETEDLSTPLHFAVLNYRPAALAALLRHKPDLDARSDAPVSFSALELAVRRPGRTAHLKLLLEAGARPKPRAKSDHRRGGLWRLFLGYTDRGLSGGPLYSDDAYGILVSPEEAAAKTRLLLAHGVAPDADALARALAAGQNEAARLLLDAGVDPAATIGNNSMLYHALFRPGARESAASGYRVIDVPRADPALLRRLLNAQGRLDGQPGWLALACKSGNLDAVRLLVEAGAPYATKGNNLIFDALSSGSDCPDVIEYLLGLGFSPTDEGGRGRSPLKTATDFPRKPRAALALVKAGAAPRELMDDLYRDFAVKAGILDRDGNILVRAPAPAPAEQQRLEEARREILAAARQNPKDALYWPLFYSVATPDEVKEIIGGRSLSGTRVIKTERDVSLGHGPASQALILALPVLIFQKEFWTGKRTVRQEYTPLGEAAGTTPYPEVIHLLVKAGCKVRDINYEALRKALFNPNPAVLEAVLSYKPDVNKVSVFYFGSLLHYLAGTNPQEFRAEHFRLLLAAGADPNALAGQDKNTPLFIAASNANAEAGRLLLAAGADPNHVNRVGDMALDQALEEGAYGLAMDILKAGGRGKAPLTHLGEAKVKPLSPAERQARDEALALLLKKQGEAGADARGSLAAAAREGNLELLRLLLARKPERAALNSALSAAMMNYGDPNKARKGAEKPAALLLAAGADPNGRIDKMDSVHSGNLNLPFLCFAARVHSPGLADLLLKAGADVNIRGDVSLDLSGINITPLMILGVFPPYPAGRENLEPFLRTARRLLAAGADVHREDEQGGSALLYSMKSPELTALLLQAGARANAATGSGWTPLTWAASREEYADAIPLLLKAGAKPGQADGRGRLPLQVALDNGNGKAVALLQAAPARKARK
ncbi:MAG: ankyrin repeat domain-containing protein [Desulfovibrio sp.]|jgi:ankyrin repeat protein|nr:ankyrin repeat domain-containing protein [Desulfovibrio sp.]